MVEFALSEEENGVRQLAAGFAAQVLAPAHKIYEHLPTQKERFQATRQIYRIASEGGLLAGLIPKPLGGTGGSLLTACVLVEEMYAADTSCALNIFATGLGLTPLILGGTPEQHKEFLAPFLSRQGEPIASLTHSEPGGTANWLEKGGKGLQTVARKAGDEYIVNGEKMWSSNHSGWEDRGADLQCLVCREVKGDDTTQDPQADPAEAIMILLVTKDVIAANDPSAYQVLEWIELPGHEATNGPRVRLTNLRVPARNVLAGSRGAGAALTAAAFTGSAALVGAMSVSIMRAAFDAALKFAKEDTRAGAEPIINRQSVSNLLMEIKMKTDACRMLTWKAARDVDAGLGAETALEAKIYCSDNCVRAVTDAMSAVGMSSYNKSSPFPRLMNDAACLPLFDGGNVGIRRRQLEKIIMAKDYQPWATTYP